MTYNKNKLYKTLDYRSKDMLNFNFSEKGLGLVFPPYFEHDFSRKMFHMLHSELLHMIQLTKFHCLIAFTFCDIGQYVYYNCLLTRLLCQPNVNL